MELSAWGGGIDLNLFVVKCDVQGAKVRAANEPFAIFIIIIVVNIILVIIIIIIINYICATICISY